MSAPCWERRSAAVALLAVGVALSCTRPDPVRATLEHRQQFAVELKSWTPRDGAVLAELQVVANFEPRIDVLTVRIVSFDENGTELASRRVGLDVGGLQVGVPLAARRRIDLPVSGGRLGVEVEAFPAASEWTEFAELRDLVPSAPTPPTP